jgi:CRP/FNR family transcriptional regulator
MARVVMVMAKQIFRLEQTIERMASQQVAQRLAATLVDELAAGEESDGGILLPVHSQEQLARLIGTTRESVSRTLSIWRSAGVIAMKGRRIVVLRPDRLRREADSDATYSNGHQRAGPS